MLSPSSNQPSTARVREGWLHAEVRNSHADQGRPLGDFLADTGGLGYRGGALVFGAALAVLHFYTSVSRTLLFWAAFILTRPLGATVGDLLDKHPA